MLVEAQLDLLKNDDWDYLLNYDLDAQQVTEENVQHLNNEDLTPEEQALKEKQEAGDNEQSNEQTENTSKDDDLKSK